MKRFFSSCKYILASFLLMATTALSSGGAVFADAISATSPLPYTGQGFPITQKCEEGTDTPAGTMLFIFAYGGNYDPTNVTLHGVTVLSQEEKGNETHIFTTYSSDLASLEQNVNVTWDGSVGNAELVISHGCAPVEKTPTTLAAVTVADNCGTDNDTFDIPDDGNGVTYTHTYVGGVLTVTATPDSTHTLVVGNSGFTLNNDGTATYTHTFTNATCTTSVETQAPVVKDDKCGTDNDIFHVPAVDGVVYKVGDTVVSGDVHTNGALSVTIHAYPASSAYTLTGQTSWTLTFTNVACPCGCEGGTDVTADMPTFKDVCGVEKDTYTIPMTAHVKYYVNDNPIAATAGTHDASGTVTIKAVADDGFTLKGEDTWSKTFTDVPCVVKVRPPKPEFKDNCEMDQDKFTIPSKTGVEYQVNGHALMAGTYSAYDYDVNGKVTVTAVALPGYQLKGKHHTWSYTFTDKSCGEGGGQSMPATPGAATFNDVCATANDTYTIPATLGVVYKVNGIVTKAGTYPASGTENVTAEAEAGYVLSGTASWSHTFTNEACVTGGGGSGGQVLGESTTVFTPTAQASAGRGGEVLANTGTSTLFSSIAAIVLMLTSVVLYAYSPKFEKNS